LCSTTVTNYDSVADFVNEAGVIPIVTLAASNTTTNSAFCGTGTQSVTFTYDSQRRLTKFTSAGGTTSYTAWDSSDRPTVGTTNGISISNVYDNAARTLTQTQVSNGAQTVTTITYDANGNQLSSVVTGAGGGTTTTYTNTSTATVCK
jgi:YD repeat-containing protein